MSGVLVPKSGMRAPFCFAHQNMSYGVHMPRIAILSPEIHWARQIRTIFPDWEMEVQQLESPTSILNAELQSWKVLILDLEAVEPHTSKITEFIGVSTSRAAHVIVLIPPRLMDLEPQFAGSGVYLLRKPTSSGEIALAMRMLLKDGERR